MSDYVIRPAQPDDVEAIARLLEEMYLAEGKPRPSDAEGLKRGLFSDKRVVNLRALVVVKEAPIAVVLYYNGYDVATNVHGYHLGDISVSAAYRGQGIGKALFTALAAQNLSEGGEWIALTALSSNSGALRFYQKLGMSHVPVHFFAVGKYTLSELVQSSMQ